MKYYRPYKDAEVIEQKRTATVNKLFMNILSFHIHCHLRDDCPVKSVPESRVALPIAAGKKEQTDQRHWCDADRSV